MSKLKSLLGAVLIAVAIAYSILAYFITTVGPHGTWDGLGRPLVEAPALAKALGRGPMWSGVLWSIADTVIFFSLIGVGFALQKE